MREAEAEGMQSQTAYGGNVVLIAIHGVVHHRVFFLPQVHSDLVSAAGVQFQFQQRVAARGLHGLIVRIGQFAPIVSR